jgi:hypothetical protein
MLFKNLLLGMLTMLSMNSESCQSKDGVKMRSIDLFKTYITGDFNNTKQITEEKNAGHQIHPLAIHINRVCDPIIDNKPTLDGFWILEESYYTKPGSDTAEIKPYLFLFESAEDNKVKLTPYTLPKDIDLKSVKNDNPSLRFDFNKISPSPTFKPAYYEREGDVFKINAVNDLPNGMKFTLIETITANQLQVMELLEKDGKRLTAYDTPIIYDRVR